MRCPWPPLRLFRQPPQTFLAPKASPAQTEALEDNPRLQPDVFTGKGCRSHL
jgi:hypothetical protein